MCRIDVPIHDVSRELRIATGTIRRWEREQALPFTVRRSAVGRRVFSAAEIEQLREFIARRHPVG